MVMDQTMLCPVTFELRINCSASVNILSVILFSCRRRVRIIFRLESAGEIVPDGAAVL